MGIRKSSSFVNLNKDPKQNQYSYEVQDDDLPFSNIDDRLDARGTSPRETMYTSRSKLKKEDKSIFDVFSKTFAQDDANSPQEDSCSDDQEYEDLGAESAMFP